MLRRWVWRAEPGAIPPRLTAAVAALGISHASLVARLLWNRGIHTPEAVVDFLRPTLARGLRAPLLVKDMARAATRLADALAAGERVAVYGDYDVDGMTGAAQLVCFLGELGAEPLLHVAQRQEGYGLNLEALRRLREAGARVVVTADCGTADVRELAAAAELGLDVIVCDHHHAPRVRPPAMALLNPLQPECAFPFKGLSGAGVVFYLLMALRAELRARGHATLPDLRRYLDLVALGTVADVVPLREENRVLVTHGLRVLERSERPGVRALMETALVENVSVRSIGFRLAPRLNASGRLADARLAVELLTAGSLERARGLAATLEMHNAERRAIEEAVVAEAVEAAERMPDHAERRTTVVAGDGWHPGVVGIAAARLAERFHRPALVVALEGALGRGSGRSVREVPLHAALAECGDLLETFGGHRQAVGFTVRRDRVARLAARFEEAVRKTTGPADLEPLLELDAEVPFRRIDAAFAAALASLEPHGPGNPEPALLAREVEVEAVRVVGDPARPHLKLRLRQEGRTLSAIGFGLGSLPLRPGDRISVVFVPRLSRWQGRERLELELLDARAAANSSDTQGADYAGEFAVS